MPSPESQSTADEIIQSVLDRLHDVPSPLGRLSIMHQVQRGIAAHFTEEICHAAEQHRAEGGTWRQIGEELDFTSQRAQQRFDRGARGRHNERQRARMSIARRRVGNYESRGDIDTPRTDPEQ